MADIIIEPAVRRRRSRRSLSDKKKAAALFRAWHGIRELIRQAEQLDDSEMVHLLSVTLLLIEERAKLTSGIAAFDEVDTSLPN